MGIMTSLMRKCGFAPEAEVRGLRQQVTQMARRNAFSSEKQRLYQWANSGASVDAEVRSSLTKARSMSREIARWNPHARKFLGLLVANVIGPTGIGLQMKIAEPNGKPDALANTIIERWYRESGRKGRYTADGKLDRVAASGMALRCVATAGEVLIRKVKNTAFPGGYTRQIIEPDLLDETANYQRGNGRFAGEVRMGVEIDEWGKPLFYHLRTRHPGDGTYDFQGSHVERVPADEIIHLFVMERPGQTRGIPWFLPVAERMKMLAGYAEAELVAARTAAAKMGFFETDGSTEYSGETDASGDFQMDAAPGSLEALPPGWRLKEWDPQHPTSAYKDFTKAMIREMAAGLLCSYTGLSGDLEGVNFSSIRQGVLDERDMWMLLQNWWIEHYEREDFGAALSMALLTGELNLPASKFQKFNSPVFQPRRWSWVDPLKDISAAGYAVALGTKSRTMVAAEQGVDFEDVLADLKAEQDAATAAGLTLQNPALPNVPQPTSEA
ncbi:MAG TPA: phage portal protein [Nitratidesulfovibrio sp.]|nr:phage portal protein [Nitratidesulfovibrio sp.]